MFKLKQLHSLFTIICLTVATNAMADTTLNMNLTAASGIGTPAGTVIITETPYGLLFTPNLHGLTAGAHGFHVHEKASCDDNGMAAGGHFDPKKTGKHLGPYNNKGHLGDLPILYVNQDGTATLPVLAPRLHHVSAIKNHALMVHHDGDNYSDEPAKLGGGGTRMVCGVIND